MALQVEEPGAQRRQALRGRPAWPAVFCAETIETTLSGPLMPVSPQGPFVSRSRNGQVVESGARSPWHRRLCADVGADSASPGGGRHRGREERDFFDPCV